MENIIEKLTEIEAVASKTMESVAGRKQELMKGQTPGVRCPGGERKPYLSGESAEATDNPEGRRTKRVKKEYGTAGTADAEVLSGEPQSSGGRTVPKDCKDVTEIWELYFPIVV